MTFFSVTIKQQNTLPFLGNLSRSLTAAMSAHAADEPAIQDFIEADSADVRFLFSSYSNFGLTCVRTTLPLALECMCLLCALAVERMVMNVCA